MDTRQSSPRRPGNARLSSGLRMRTSSRGSLGLLTCITVCLVLTGAAEAAPGDLDDTFSGDGKARTNFSAGRDAAFALAIQTDQKIVLAGMANRYQDSRFALARYHPDGTLDDTFGGDGRVVTNLTPGADIAFDVAVQSDGGIVAVGRAGGAGGRFAAVRYLADGTVDSTFGGDGIVTTNFTRHDDFASAVAIQDDGGLVVVGRARQASEVESRPRDSAAALVRYHPDGTLDETFSLDGRILANLTPGRDHALDVALASDDRLVVVGRSGREGGGFAILRYSTRGVRDATFGDGDGEVFVNFARFDDWASSVALQDDGRIVAAGTASRRSASGFGIVRLESDGSIDTTFSGDGKIVTRFTEYFESAIDFDGANGVEIQADGKIVVAGASVRSVFLGMCCELLTVVARYTSGGILDDSFSGDGKVVPDLGFSHGGNGVAIQADGKVVTAGEAFDDPLVTTFLVLRLVVA
jgi:uncharacterized delta-60 repeat protein